MLTMQSIAIYGFTAVINYLIYIGYALKSVDELWKLIKIETK